MFLLLESILIVFAEGYNLYGEKNVDIELIQQYLGTFPLLGMFGGFEIASVSTVYSYI